MSGRWATTSSCSSAKRRSYITPIPHDVSVPALLVRLRTRADRCQVFFLGLASNDRAVRQAVTRTLVGPLGWIYAAWMSQVAASSRHPEDDVRNKDVRCAERIHNPVSLPSADQDPATNFDSGRSMTSVVHALRCAAALFVAVAALPLASDRLTSAQTPIQVLLVTGQSNRYHNWLSDLPFQRTTTQNSPWSAR